MDFSYPCERGEVDQRLRRAVVQGDWFGVSHLMSRCSNPDLRKEIIAEACKRTGVDGRRPLFFVLRHCSMKEMNFVCKEVVMQRKWTELTAMDTPLKVCSERYRSWAITQASRHADSTVLCDLLRHCSDDQVESIYEEALKRGMWQFFYCHTFREHISDDFKIRLIEEAAQKADDNQVKALFRRMSVFPDQLLSIYTTLVKRDLWESICTLLEKDKCIARDTLLWIIRQGVIETEACRGLRRLLDHCPQDQVEPLFTEAVQRGRWIWVSFLLDKDAEHEKSIDELQRIWAVEECIARAKDDEDIYNITFHCDEKQLQAVLCREVRCGFGQCVDLLMRNNFNNTPFVELVSLWARCFVHTVQHAAIVMSPGVSPFCQKEAFLGVVDSQHTILMNLLEKAQLIKSQTATAVSNFVCHLEAELKDAYCREEVVYQFDTVLHKYFQRYFKNRGQEDSPEWFEATQLWIILPMFAVQNVNPTLQNIALQFLLKTSKWEAVADAPTSHMWGEIRRSLFRAAVEQHEWPAVMKLSDHNLDDDQRYWALGEALRERQMEVLVVLAEHGLTDGQLRRANRHMARHAHWDLFLKLLDRGVNVKQVREDLETANIGRERPPKEADVARHKELIIRLRKLEKKIFSEAKDYPSAIALHNWPALYRRFRCEHYKGREEEIITVLGAAVEEEAWSAVVQLVKVGLKEEQRDNLFTMAMDRRLWGVARALLERQHGVSGELCRRFLCRLISERQWVLVTKLLYQDVDNDLRRSVLQQALDERQGSVAEHCLTTLKGVMSATERQEVFTRSLAEDQWLAVRPLVQEKDEVGIRHRDAAFLAAVDRELWEEVDNCIYHGADIDVKDTQGHTLMQRAARDECWSKVEGLVNLGANQFLKDTEGYVAIQRVLRPKVRSWKLCDALKTLVEFHGDINLPDPEGVTPLQRFIQFNMADMVECALLWGRNVGEQVSYKGKTVLHLMCEEGLWDMLRYIVARGGDPLARDARGNTVLSYAVQQIWGEKCKLLLVAECILLGVTPYQPYVNLLIRLGYINTGDSCFLFPSNHESPFKKAYRQRNLTILQMLYESGACSNLELFGLFRDARYIRLQGAGMEPIYDYIDHVATNPRSLQSLCRIVISLFVGVGKFRDRRRRVDKLPVLSGRMKDYVLFYDLISDKLRRSMRYKFLKPSPTADRK